GKLGSTCRPPDAARLSLIAIAIGIVGTIGIAMQSGSRERSGLQRRTGSRGQWGRHAILDQRDRVAQHIGAGARLDAVLGEVTAERPRARHAVKRADKMPRDRMQSRALRELVL